MPKTLLLADDSVVIQKLVALSFANEDIEVVTVYNGDDAVESARAAAPDVVLADVVMPGRNGYEVCEAIKQDPNLRHVPVLLLSGTFEAFDEERAQTAGADGHITKPFESQTLVERVRELLGTGPAAVPPAATDSGSGYAFFGEETAVPPSPAAPVRADSLAPPLHAEAELPDAPTLDSLDSSRTSGWDQTPSATPNATSGTEPAGDRTVALIPDDGDFLDAAAPEASAPGGPLETSSASGRWDSGSTGDPLTQSGMTSVPDLHVTEPVPEPDFPITPDPDVVEDLFAETPVPDSAGPSGGVDLEAADLGEPAAALDLDLDLDFDPAQSAVARDADFDPTEDSAYDVSTSDLADSFPDFAAPDPAPVANAPDPGTRPPAAPDPGAVDLSPAMRQQIHETLEKVAWDAFADLSDAVVRQVLERVERVAWEVIPQMAEAMIREEIRQMKGENDS